MRGTRLRSTPRWASMKRNSPNATGVGYSSLRSQERAALAFESLPEELQPIVLAILEASSLAPASLGDPLQALSDLLSEHQSPEKAETALIRARAGR